MSTFTITSSSLNNQYTYTNDTLMVQGNYNMNATDNSLRDVNGSIYQRDANGNQGAYVGNFNGYNRDGVIRYSLSEMTRQQSEDAWEAIGDIEGNILGTNSESPAE